MVAREVYQRSHQRAPLVPTGSVEGLDRVVGARLQLDRSSTGLRPLRPPPAGPDGRQGFARFAGDDFLQSKIEHFNIDINS